jgi:hypothetical protein
MQNRPGPRCAPALLIKPVNNFMSRFRFRGVDGGEITPTEWLRMWAARYPSKKYYAEEYDALIGNYKSLSAADFERIGKWKDGAKTQSKWKANVASVAYEIWMQAAKEMPVCPEETQVAAFLNDWSERKYTDHCWSRTREKRFGLSRATTLLHFVSGGRVPIFDSRVRKAMARLLNCSVPNEIPWYLDSYCPLIKEIAALSGTEDLRTVDKALFSYGGNLRFPD